MRTRSKPPSASARTSSKLSNLEPSLPRRAPNARATGDAEYLGTMNLEKLPRNCANEGALLPKTKTS